MAKKRALAQIAETFKANEGWYADLLEPYSTRLAGAADDAERLEIMRAGLRETLRRRWPNAAADAKVDAEMAAMRASVDGAEEMPDNRA